MNPVVLGALIGAIPALLAAALATWAAVRTSRISIEQTQLTHAADHARWLRDKRCELYVETIKFVSVLSMHREAILAGMSRSVIEDAMTAAILPDDDPVVIDLMARGDAFASTAAAAAFHQALTSDSAAWEGLAKELPAAVAEGRLVLTGETHQLFQAADMAERELSSVIRDDLATAYRSIAPSRSQRGTPGIASGQ
jgi:hypothetical protein